MVGKCVVDGSVCACSLAKVPFISNVLSLRLHCSICGFLVGSHMVEANVLMMFKI